MDGSYGYPGVRISDYWRKKINYNRIHDKKITQIFKLRGWTVIRIWECELNNDKKVKLIRKINILLD